MRTIACLAAAVALCFSLGCTRAAVSPSTPEQPPVTAAPDPLEIAKSMDMRLSEESTTSPVTLPAELTGSQWGAVQSACLAAGYDLRPYAGKSVIVTEWLFVDPPPDRPSGLVVIEREGHIVGAYTFTTGMYPGISSLGVDQTP